MLTSESFGFGVGGSVVGNPEHPRNRHPEASIDKTTSILRRKQVQA